MAKRKTATTESANITSDYHTTPEGPVTTTTPMNDVERAFADRPDITSGDQVEQPQNGNGHAEGNGQRKPWPPIREFGTFSTPDNRVVVGKNDRFRTRNGSTGAFFIYFDKNPNESTGPNGETYSKESPHPVIKHMHDSGYKYERAPDGDMAWTKPYDQGRGWSMKQEMDAQDVARSAANLLGANLEVGQGQSR